MELKKVLFKEAQVDVGGQLCAIGNSLDLEVMLADEAVVVGEDELGEFDEELSGW